MNCFIFFLYWISSTFASFFPWWNIIIDLIKDGLQEAIDVINDVQYKEGIWLKLKFGGKNGRMYMCIGCIYLPTQGTHVVLVQKCCKKINC